MAEDRPRVLDGGADVEVAALRVVRGDEEEAARVLVVDARRVHEAAGARRLEGLGQLADLERPDVRRDRDELIRLQEVDHLPLTRLVRRQELRLILRHVRGARRIRASEGRVLEHRFERAIARELHFAEHRDLVRVERQQQHVLQQVVVCASPIGFQSGMRARARLEPVRILVQGFERAIAGLARGACARRPKAPPQASSRLVV